MKTVLIIALATASLAACGGKKTGGTTTTGGGSADTLYAHFGGEAGVKAVVKDFVEEQVAKDDRINKFFKGVDIPKLEQLLFEQICEAAGGGCHYTGRDMKTTHATMKVTADDFDHLVEDLIKSLDKFNVKPADKDALLKVLGGMKGDIVTA